MVKIGKDAEKLPDWLLAKKPMMPDFVARDPKVIQRGDLLTISPLLEREFNYFNNKQSCVEPFDI